MIAPHIALRYAGLVPSCVCSRCGADEPFDAPFERDDDRDRVCPACVDAGELDRCTTSGACTAMIEGA